MKTVVVAMDKFKGSASAEQVCSAVCAGFQRTAPGWECIAVPLADGGDGTVAALCRAGWTPRTVAATDAQGAPVTAEVAWNGGTALVELASICGIARWQGARDPWHAHTTGVGEAIRQCIEAGAEHMVLAVGGSASTDGGLGALLGLGFHVVDAQDAQVQPGLAGLRTVARVEPPSDVEALRRCTWTVLVDVDSPLCGPRGAARRFGPQKGLTDADVEVADELLQRWDELLAQSAGRHVGHIPGTGAAGGIPAAFVALLDAHIESGFEFVAKHAHVAAHIDAADLVVTGEGRVDASSMTGKVVGEVVKLAAHAGVEAVVVAGSVDAQVRVDLPEQIVTLVEVAGDKHEAMSHPADHLEEVGGLIGQQRA